MSETARTPLHAWHVAHGGRMVDFAGWSMPVQYTSIVEEHQATRQHVGLFDISHMGRIRFRGSGACRFLDRLLTRRVSDLMPGAVRYSLVTHDGGGILDDVLVYRLVGPADDYALVVNASNRVKILAWLASHLGSDVDVQWEDETATTTMIAVQGPAAVSVVNELVEQGPSVDAMKYYTSTSARVAGVPVLLSRTGYTGEDGCELVASASEGERLWTAILQRGSSRGAQPVGLGARDTLRLEAGMPLYGHELTEAIDPFEADLAFAVNLNDREFPGSRVLSELAGKGSDRKRVGLVLEGKRVPREGFRVLMGDEPIGGITSGTYSPTLDRPIAMAYIRHEKAIENHTVTVDVRGKPADARIVRLPFYKRSR